MSESSNARVKALKLLLHVGFFISGISTVLIGQVLPILSSKFGLNDQQTANFFPAQFAGSLTGTFLTNWFGKRGRFLAASAIGCSMMAFGALLLNLGSYELCLVGFYVNGVGIGLTLPAINMLILELSPQNTTSALTVLNFFWGFGAIVSQPFVDLLSRRGDIVLPTGLLAASLLIVAIAIAFMPSSLEPRPFHDDSNESAQANPPIWTTAVAWMIAAFNFIHVGFETAIGGWLKTFTQRVETESTVNYFPPIFLYFLFFVIGRGVSPVFVRFMNDNTFLFASLLTTAAGVIVLLTSHTVAGLSLGAAIAGFGTSSIFPTNMSRFTKTFGPTASRRAMPFFICGTLGASFTTWFIGFISNRFESLRLGMYMLLASIVVLIAVQLTLQFKFKPTPDRE